MTDIDKFHEWVETQSPLALREYMFAQAAWQARGELDKALAETQEPMTHVIGLDNDGKEVVVKLQTPLYTTPPSREWQSLSDEEIDAIFPLGDDVDVLDVARGIEKALREKNDG